MSMSWNHVLRLIGKHQHLTLQKLPERVGYVELHDSKRTTKPIAYQHFRFNHDVTVD